MQLYPFHFFQFLFRWLTIALFVLVMIHPSHSQVNELVQVHTDQSFYFAGDTIWTSVFMKDTAKVGTNTKWVQSFLLTSEKAVAAEGKIKIVNGKGWSYIVIDSLAKSGTYTLYTFLPFSSAGTKQVNCKPLLICNLNNYKSLVKSSADTNAKMIIDNRDESGGNIKSNIAAQFSKLDNTNQWQIKLTDRLGDAVQANFSISILDSALTPKINTADSSAEVQSFHAHKLAGKELNITGEVKFTDHVPSEINEVILVDSADNTFIRHQIFGNRTPQFTIANIDLEGIPKLYLELKKNYGKEVRIVFPKDSFDFKFVFPPMTLEHIERLVLFKKLEKVFYKKINSSPTKNNMNQPVLLTTAEIRNVYDLTKYMRFKTMKETISEIIGVIKIRTKKEKISIKVSDGERKMFFEEEPLFIIDGLASYDNKVLFDLDPADVKTIEVIHPRNIVTQWRGAGRYGIIDVHTIQEDYILGDIPNRPKIDFKGYNKGQPKAPFIPVAQDNHPDFRPRLYWNPDLQTGVNGKVEIQILPNHNVSNYYYYIKGITADGKFFELKSKVEFR